LTPPIAPGGRAFSEARAAHEAERCFGPRGHYTEKDREMNANQTNPSMRNDTAPDVIARISIGVEACDDNIGSICLANRGNGFSVFINGGVLPQGEDERFFPASDVRCLADAYAFALSIVQQLIEEEVQIDSMMALGGQK
jgi:hypothetical protein